MPLGLGNGLGLGLTNVAATGGGGGGGGPTLLDAFTGTSKNTTLWGTDGNFNDAFGAAVGTVSQSGSLTITPAASTTGYTGRISTNAASFVGKYVIFQRLTTDVLQTEAMVKVGPDSTSGYAYYASGGSIFLFGWDSVNTRTNLGSFADPDYAGNNAAPTTYTYIKFYHDNTGDTINIDTGTSASGPWTNRLSVARSNTYWNKTTTPNLKLAMVGGQWGSSASPGTVGYDNLYSDMAL